MMQIALVILLSAVVGAKETPKQKPSSAVASYKTFNSKFAAAPPEKQDGFERLMFGADRYRTSTGKGFFWSNSDGTVIPAGRVLALWDDFSAKWDNLSDLGAKPAAPSPTRAEIDFELAKIKAIADYNKEMREAAAREADRQMYIQMLRGLNDANNQYMRSMNQIYRQPTYTNCTQTMFGINCTSY